MNNSIITFTLPFTLLFTLLFAFTTATNFEIRNECSYTVWAAATHGGGRRLDPGQSWTINVAAGKVGRIWGRTNCNFDSSGRGQCETGDCGGVLECTGWGRPPNTLAEYALHQFSDLDLYDISLVDGFNIPMDFSPTNSNCRRINCTADINGQCPDVLKAPGGCNHPCTVFQTPEYCCNEGPGTCGPNTYSRFFKQSCPDAYSFPQDDPASTLTCPSGTTDYRVVFCPRNGSRQFPLEMVTE